MYNIVANNKTYEITDHAAERMMIRELSQAMIIETLEVGDLIHQRNGRDRYELQFDAGEKFIIIQVIVDEPNRCIVTVIDDTQDKEQ
jgi:hypothetical protein